jgi:glycerol-3-phosphate dehydrogenase (NAD(P)+)
MSNGIREMKNSSRKSTNERNINDSAYLGDLLVTGYSVFSIECLGMIGKELHREISNDGNEYGLPKDIM